MNRPPNHGTSSARLPRPSLSRIPAASPGRVFAQRALALALALAGLGAALAFLHVSPLVLLAVVCLGVGAALLAAAFTGP